MEDLRIEVAMAVDPALGGGDPRLPAHDHYYDCDTGPLAMPADVRIGLKDHAGMVMLHYGQQVDEYAVRLEDRVRDRDPEVLTELDRLFNMALSGRLLIGTRCWAMERVNHVTHAHQLARMIRELAEQAEKQIQGDE